MKNKNQTASLKNILLKSLSFPILFFGLTYAGVILWEKGMNPNAILGLTVIPFIVCLVALEKIIPYHVEWRKNRGDVKTDAVHLLSMIITGSLTSALSLKPAFAVIAALKNYTGFENNALAGLPFLGQIVIGIVAGDFIPYWLHRISHERSGLLRKIHAVHHSVGRVYFFNAVRLHPFNIMYNVFFRSVVLTLLGAGNELIFTLTLISLLHNFASHANVDFKLGPLNYFFSMTELHRLHHSDQVSESDGNYGGVTIFWDILFKSRIAPHYIAANRIGLPESPLLQENYLKQVASPFCFKNENNCKQVAYNLRPLSAGANPGGNPK